MSLPEIMDIGELDPYCTKLLSIFILEHKAYRFNELQRLLKDMRLKITTPTLTLHLLDHLVKKKIVLRDEKDKKFVTYSLNWERWPNLDQLLKDRILGEKAFQKELDEFSKRTVEEQILYVHSQVVLMSFFSLRNSIVATIKPGEEFEAGMNAIHFGNVMGRVEDMILNNIEKLGEDYTLECLSTIDRLTYQYNEVRSRLGMLAKIPLPVIFADKETLDLLKKIKAHLNENKKMEERKPELNILHSALEEYARKYGIL